MTMIKTANINWQTDDNGMTVPTSHDFDDVYFSRDNGLAESRHVFIGGNDLAERLANLHDYQTFVIGEIGFGTGLNVLAIWQLWYEILQQTPHKNTRLHIITTEKYPLTKPDLAKALSVWHELQPFAKQLLENYPPPLAGCHRLHFWADRLTIDIWLGDASDSLANITGNAKVNAWLLDGFAPDCNEELWGNLLFSQIAKLSEIGTTLSTFSVAGKVKKSLSDNGFSIKKVKGFGKKREMLTAVFTPTNLITAHTTFETHQNLSTLKFKPLKPTKLIHYKKTGSHLAKPPFSLVFARKKTVIFSDLRSLPDRQSSKIKQFSLPTRSTPTQKMHIAVIGAGVAGLSTAWALAMRGHHVTVIDEKPPLSGASGNPRAVIAPKLTELERLPSNLHAIGYLASLRYYPALADFTQDEGLNIFEKTGLLDLLRFNRVTAEQVNEFPSEFALLLDSEQSKNLAEMAVGEAIFFREAGMLNTQHFAKAVLSHPNIHLLSAKLNRFTQQGETVAIELVKQQNIVRQDFDHLILCTAQATCDFLPHIKPFNFSRGQVSWFNLDKKSILPKLPLKYGGYCGSFSHEGSEYFLLGASFIRDRQDTTPTDSEHMSNLAEFEAAIGQEVKSTKLENWYGRAGIRSQTVDYLPLLGQVGDSESRVWTFSALGSKGYCYAPVCSEVLAGLICGEIVGLDKVMVEKLSPNRRSMMR